MAWTKDQKKAIDARNSNLLVSAAAGSGKTAVLVERIINRVTDSDNPIDIDTIVVVTFTKAAAQEMKSRLSKAFEKAIEENPGNLHLLKQISLLDNARISTIDSFCGYILNNYYNSIEIDPSYRVADAGELSLIKEDVFNELLEERLENEDGSLTAFIDAFAPGKGIDNLSQIIQRLYTYSQSNPWPDEWLDECHKIYHVSSEEEYSNLPIVKENLNYVKELCKESARDCISLIKECEALAGLEGYTEALEDDKEHWERAGQANSIDAISMLLDFKFATLKGAKNADPDEKKFIQNCRDTLKKRRKSITEKFLFDTKEQFEQIQKLSAYADICIELAKEFSEKYNQAKKKKNVADFSDIEHYALNILVKRENGVNSYTPVANELAEVFNEIYIDEYQDSNLVQEYILNAVSKERFGSPDTFMVGDVKQSIYKFRMAKPELFMEKYDTYKENGPFTKIELHKNFRSRAAVLESINEIFKTIMIKTVGGIDYTENVYLNPGMEFDNEFPDTTELLVIDSSNSSETEGIDASASEMCAHVAADRIKRMRLERPELKYKDFVILLRSDKTSGPVYSAILNEHRIPCIYSSTTGYFDSYEISGVMDLLKIIDNPRQEIALAAVMRSYFAYFSAKELAAIKGRKRRTQLYDCVCLYAAKDDETAKKCQQLLDLIKQYREYSIIFTISEIISKIIYDSGYYDYIGAMTGGEARKANLDMLVQKAVEYEKTSYSGLFNFVRYIEKLRKYDVDYGESQTLSEEDDVVRIMSIHKSKGLEFPVVIIGDMGKKFNFRDLTAPLLYDSTYGIGLDCIDIERRVKTTGIYKNMIANKMMSDSIGEEIRILYVAMTRAVDKLIMIGTAYCKTAQKKWQKFEAFKRMETGAVLDCANFIDMVAPVVQYKEADGLFYSKTYQMEDLINIAKTTNAVQNIAKPSDNNAAMPPSEEKYNEIKKIIEFQYPHRNIFSLRSKYSVSDLKHQAMEESELLEARLEAPESDKPIPSFIRQPEQVSGVFRGNAYHKVFELFEYDKAKDADSIRQMFNCWISEDRISKEYIDLIDVNHFVRFIESDLGQAMKKAYLANTLFREQPFIMEINANEVEEDMPADEKVLVQGIIDAFYFYEEKIYIVDYKTDRIPQNADGEEILRQRYAKQLVLYCEALSKITQKSVGGCYIYSVALDKKIDLQYS